ncbi:alginate lyase family protein [Paenibacillus cremeus]|uniref:Alginate lyase family protein n=1 Tax=Paenibacillus cremeus TaxID=2163881 RepID=A0A559KFL6_9BACL|nr:alginate lyase family protein [Paenibacillus cremeus]TVY10922.1 alginate lyase family protein [Paenibacillus cremeus]
MGFVFVDPDFVRSVKLKVAKADGVWRIIRRDLQEKADEALQRGPWSVTSFGAVAPSGDPHDYVSEAPYWWPDPENPDGPYIRKDGITRHDRFMGHRSSIDELSGTVLTLCTAGYYLDEKRYTTRAAELLRIWFVDPETRMNPHVEYGEAIRGICNGRAAGIIMLRQVDRIVHALGFMEELSSEWDDVLTGMREWLSQMLEWLTTSKIGLDESRSSGNHAVWWTTHVAAYAAYTGNKEKLQLAFDHFKHVIVPEQIQPDGSLPKELERTRSFHYTLFQLDGAALLCEIAHLQGEDLWHYRTANGISFQSAIEFVLPYLDNPYLWKWEQIDGEIPEEYVSLQLASLRLQLPECSRVNMKRRGEAKWVKDGEERLGPLVFLPGHPFHAAANERSNALI